MNISREDRRTVRTKSSILEAYSKLLEEKTYYRITVTDVAEKAGINRKTFYSYYNSIEDMQEKLEEALTEKYRPLLENVHLAEGFDAYAFFAEFNKYIEEDLPVFEVLAKAGRIAQITEKLNNIIVEVFLRDVGQEDNEKSILFARYAASGIVAMFAAWSYSHTMSLEEFTDMTAKISLAGYAAIHL